MARAGTNYFRRGFLVALGCLAFLDDGGVAIMRFTASSNVTPFSLKSIARGISLLNHKPMFQESFFHPHFEAMGVYIC